MFMLCSSLSFHLLFSRFNQTVIFSSPSFTLYCQCFTCVSFLLLPLLFSKFCFFRNNFSLTLNRSPSALPLPPALRLHFLPRSIFHSSTTLILRSISPPSVRLLDTLCLPASCLAIASVERLTSLVSIKNRGWKKENRARTRQDKMWTRGI